MGATRLPGKPLKEVMGRPMLSYLMERLDRVRLADAVVLATTTNPKDNQLVAYCEETGRAYFRGSEEDVLERFLQAARKQGADAVVRITADCPLMDPELVDQVIETFLKGGYDYVTNRLDSGSRFPRGMDVEVFSMKSFEEVAKEAKQPAEREHVTPFYYRHPERFKIGSVVNETDLSQYRWTVDTPEDFKVIVTVFEHFYPVKPNFTLDDLVKAFEEHPQWAAINAHVKQKALGE